MEVAIIIPIYKEILSPSEIISLIRCNEILGEFPIKFICSQGLNTNCYLKIIPNASFEYFKDSHFVSIEGYNKLMLSTSFYKRFFQYRFILIYQLDAYVFENKLLYWCKKNYDYIGAPWIVAPTITKEKYLINTSNWFVNRVGNGGLSLRKIKPHFWNSFIFAPFLKIFIKNEDMFWGVLIDKLNPFFKKPKYTEALRFAFELNPKDAFIINNCQLPFGVHAWEKYDEKFWLNYIN